MNEGAATGAMPRFLRACQRLPVDRTPVWFMRQAGRYMAVYRTMREKHSLLEICRQPELAAEVTLQPVKALGVDAAILFADILLPLIPMGAELEFAPGHGPVIHNPVRSRKDVSRIPPVDVEGDLGYVLKAIRILRTELPPEVPLIGFAGGPFTVASYLIEGRATRTFEKTKGMMYSAPNAWHALLGRLAHTLADYLVAQIEAGAQAVQLFDSWVGALSPADYRAYVLPHSATVLRRVQALGVPTIHFGTNTAALLSSMREAGGTVMGVDWRIPLDVAWKEIGEGLAIQGNLDPLALFSPREVLEAQVRRVLREAGDRPGHIFNLGHGILPATPVENVQAVVEMVHAFSLKEPGKVVL